MVPVGFHRFVLENFTGDKLDGVSEREVKEFDPPSEVSKYMANLPEYQKFFLKFY